jgi:hypothetical protein
MMHAAFPHDAPLQHWAATSQQASAARPPINVEKDLAKVSALRHKERAERADPGQVWGCSRSHWRCY